MRAQVIGFGASTAVGLNAAQTAAAVRAGIAGMQQHPYMVDGSGDPLVVAAAHIPPDLTDPVDRLLALAQPAIEETRRHSGFGMPIHAVVAMPPPRPGLSPDTLQSVSDRLRRSLTPVDRLASFEVIARGHAAGVGAFERALSVIQEDGAAAVIVGGIDSYLFADTIDWLDATDQVHCEANAWGFFPGEAAAFCLLCDNAQAERAGVQGLISVRSAATSQEANRIRTETVCIGEGLTAAWRGALEHATLELPFVGATFLDMNGQPYRADEYGFSMLRTRQFFLDDDATFTPADCLGDVGAASAALYTILAATAHCRHYASHRCSLVSTSSDDGLRGAMVLAGELGRER